LHTRFKVLKKKIRVSWRSFLKTRVLIKFSPKFIRRRYREVPTGALMELQKRRVWSVFAKLTRRSRQVSGKVLTKEINAVYSGSSSSFLHRLRDLEYKKADFFKSIYKESKTTLLSPKK